MMNDESRKRAPIPRYSLFIINCQFFIIHSSFFIVWLFFIIHCSFFIVSYKGKVTLPVSAHVDIWGHTKTYEDIRGNLKTFEDIRKRKHRRSRLSKEPHNQFHLRFQEKLAVFLVARPLELPFQFRTLLDPSPQPLQGTFFTCLRKIQARQLTFPVSLQAEPPRSSPETAPGPVFNCM